MKLPHLIAVLIGAIAGTLLAAMFCGCGTFMNDRVVVVNLNPTMVSTNQACSYSNSNISVSVTFSCDGGGLSGNTATVPLK